MLHATCKQGNWGDFRLLMVRSQIVNLIFGPFFGHNLCLKCPNGSCDPILNMYVLTNFQWYKKLFNPMGFDPYNYSLKIQESKGTPTPKVGTPLGVWGFIPSHFPTFPITWDLTPEFHSWPAPLQDLVLVVSPRLRLQHIQWIINGHCNSKIKFKASYKTPLIFIMLICIRI